MNAPARITTLIALLAAFVVRADTITLKRTVRVEPGAPITLADIADLDGAHAARLADIVIAENTDALARQNPGDADAPNRWTLGLGAVRDTIDARDGVNWAFLSLRGRDVTLIAPDRRPIPRRADDATAADTAARPEGITSFPEGSIGRFARGVVRTILRVGDADLRMVWPAREADFLTRPVGTRTVHVQPIGTSDRMPLEITVYDGDRIVRTEVVRAAITVRRRVHTISKPLNRGTAITSGDFTTREAWVGPGVDPAPAATGQIAARRLESGTIIETDDISPPLVVERGELITLHCVSGAIAIRVPARALADGRDGETVPVEMEGSKRRVLARMNGAGKAVLVVRPNEPVARADRATARARQPEGQTP
jgi:flagella basal body P-ring formation protein FlgA